MPIMPYAMEKGPYLSIVEDYLNGELDRAVKALEDLREGAAVVDLGPLDGQYPGIYTPAQLKQHVGEDWWGFRPVLDPSSGEVVGWDPQEQFDASTNPTTGFWQHWYGDPEAVFRQTLQRALEVALGVEHVDGPGGGPVHPTRHWFISMFWNCPHPWYEGWVSWHRRSGSRRSGQVTMVVNTPAHIPPSTEPGHHNGELFNSPLRPAGDPPDKIQPYEVEPTEATGDNGLWLVSQVYHQEWSPAPTSSAPSPPGTFRPPVLGRPVQSLGRVITVAIAERDGGVLPDGRPYVP
jgi:hypothetical protein